MNGRRILFSLTAILFAGTAFGANFYVATNGNDGGTGSSTLPWATLQHAVENIGPGDVILVRAGTYKGVRIENSGLASSGKTLRVDTGAHVILSAPGPKNKHNSILEVENFSATVGYWTIDGFEIANSPKYGVDIRVTQSITVQNCTVHNSALTGIFTAFSNHPTIQSNLSYSNGEHGIYHSNSGDYPTIVGNQIHNNVSAGIHMNGDLSEGGDGIISFATVEKNIVWENGTSGGSGINCDGVDNSLFSNNLLYSNHASGISLYAIDGAHGSSNNKVYNNTIVMAADGRFAINIPKSPKGKADPIGNQIVNNILYTYSTSNVRGSEIIYTAKPSGFVSDYNVLVNRMSDDNDNTVISLATWRQKTGQDVHSVISDAATLFVDPTHNNFRLKAGSPAINAGTLLSQVPDDILGVKRPQGGLYDIGCYESF
ncbi:MAG TPA: right-handed parallel beta-helix repeat-containing protein [Bryobacteraceae bacterium]|nr:right-handed parallel beta-helix repeat-containing protein [Bryobacteraceae bacterium]